MTPNESSSGRTSATTSTSGTKATDKPMNKKDENDKKPTKAPALTEAQYLEKQAAEARAAIEKVVGDIKRALGSTVDPRQWTKQYPWIATGTAVGAGFAAGYFLTPRDRDEAEEMWEKIKEKFASIGKPEENAVVVEPVTGAPAQQQSSLLGTIVREAIKSVGPLITTLVGGAMGASAGASHNGHEEAEKKSSANPS